MKAKRKILVAMMVSGLGVIASADNSYSGSNYMHNMQGRDMRHMQNTNMSDKTIRMVEVDTVRSMQSALKDEGYKVRVDGVVGPNTQQAIREFQTDRELSITGKINSETLSALGVGNSYREPASVEEEALPVELMNDHPMRNE